MKKQLNPDKQKVKCTVPLCYGIGCNEERKSFCALRKYYLLHLSELNKQLNEYYSVESKAIIERRIACVK